MRRERRLYAVAFTPRSHLPWPYFSVKMSICNFRNLKTVLVQQRELHCPCHWRPKGQTMTLEVAKVSTLSLIHKTCQELFTISFTQCKMYLKDEVKWKESFPLLSVHIIHIVIVPVSDGSSSVLYWQFNSILYQIYQLYPFFVRSREVLLEIGHSLFSLTPVSLWMILGIVFIRNAIDTDLCRD